MALTKSARNLRAGDRIYGGMSCAEIKVEAVANEWGVVTVVGETQDNHDPAHGNRITRRYNHGDPVMLTHAVV